MKHFALAVALAVTPALSFADAQSDAEYIIGKSMTEEVFEAAISAQAPLIISAIQHDLGQKGITIPDPDRFFTIFIEEFIGEFTETMQELSVPLYLDLFSEQELADIAAFLATPSGDAYVSKSNELLMQGAALGQLAGARAGENASARVAARLEAEGINLYADDPGLMQKLLDALR